MVQLQLESPLSKQYPFMQAWDRSVRHHYYPITSTIIQLRASLQRSKRYILSFSYPFSYQSNLLNLSLLNKKRDLGSITDNEKYKEVQPKIHTYYGLTFGSKLLFPTTGFMVGGLLFVITRMKNTTMTVSLVALGLCMGLDYMRMEKNGYAKNKTNEFLQWLLEYRAGKGIIEMHGHKIQREEYKKHFGQRNANALFEQYVGFLKQK